MEEPVFDLSRFRTGTPEPISRDPAPRKDSVAIRFQGEFLKGPIPLSWLKRAAVLPGKALHVGLAFWFQHGRRKNLTFPVTAAVLARFGVARKAGYNGLGALEKAGLIKATRRPGKNPVVTLLCNEDGLTGADATGEAL